MFDIDKKLTKKKNCCWNLRIFFIEYLIQKYNFFKAKSANKIVFLSNYLLKTFFMINFVEPTFFAT